MTTVVILDDERRSCRQLYAILGERFNARAFHAALRAFKYLKRHAVDVLVVRISRTGVSATAMLNRLRQEGSQIPTIVLLDHGVSHGAELLRQLGGLRAFRWPPREVDLVSTVKAAAATKGQCMNRSA